ncbi:MAG: hypothetical protein ACI8XM_002647 [Haloarculaceae archaeon]|jgi:hypothetical protein
MSPASTDGGAEKATIQVLDKNGTVKESFDVPFNPSEYDVDSSLQYSEQDVPGHTSPVTQFVNGTATSLSMELFFDRYEAGEDVRQDTEKIESLLDLDDQRKAPPVLRVAWSTLQFTCVLESANTTYTLFMPDGTPARARMNVTFTEYSTAEKKQREQPGTSEDNERIHVVTEGDTLWDIAAQQYGDPTKWRKIADENGISNPRTLQPGTELTIPSLEGSQ